MAEPLSNIQKINLLLNEMGYSLVSTTIKPGIPVPTMQALEEELLEVLVGFKHGQCKPSNEIL